MFSFLDPPEIKGRDLRMPVDSRGKRHYWGHKGKSYGFYTTNDEI